MRSDRALLRSGAPDNLVRRALEEHQNLGYGYRTPDEGVRRSVPKSRLQSRSFEALAPFLPLFSREDSRTYFDQSRQHLENRYWSPFESLPRAESPAVQFIGDTRVRP